MPRPRTTCNLLLCSTAFLLLSGCGNQRSEKQFPDGSNAILITVDTLRADHLEPYGYTGVRTPAINKLAADGVVFKQDISQVPLTIPSHCSILTGLWPNATGVRDQAGFRLNPDKVTLAKTLQNAGLQTAAFIGSSILNSETGLGQGFDVYTNVTGGANGPSEEGLERRGDQVMADALRWIETPGRGRFFVWIHLFDPHTPYAAPEPYRTQYARAPYDGEIAFVDSSIDQLTRALAAKGLYDKTSIVFTSDHGESLGEHGEESHGFFLYDATLHVPLIVKFPGGRWKGQQVAEQVRGIDVAPTLLETLSVPIPPQMQGQALLTRIRGERKGRALPAFSETYYPFYHFGWSPLLSLRTEQYKFIHAPKPELYDVVADPGEKKNALEAHPEVAEKWKTDLTRGYQGPLSALNRPPQPASVDPATVAKLKSLGYIGSGPAKTGVALDRLADPKDKIQVYTLLQQALADSEKGRLRESNAKLRQVLRQDRTIVDAHLNLGVNLVQLEDFAGAAQAFKQAIAADPRNVIATYNLALAYARLGKLPEAITGFTRTLELDPRHAPARVDLGRSYELQGNGEKAVDEFRRAIADDPGFAPARYYLGRAYQRKGMQKEAEAEWAEAKRLGFAVPDR